jgi:hypothetical protein
MLEAHRRGAQRHSAATRFDASAYVAFDGNRTSWGREPLRQLYLPDTLDHAFTEFNAWSDDPDAPYVDCHAWHFTPASFRLLILELGALGYCDWHISWLAPQPAVEFITHLKPGAEIFISPRERDDRRLELLKQTLVELHEQLVEPPPLFDDAAWEELRHVAATGAFMREALPKLLDELSRQRSQAAETATLLRDALAKLSDATEADQRRQVAETAAMVRAALRPVRAIWRGALPVRRAIARLRGRI